MDSCEDSSFLFNHRHVSDQIKSYFNFILYKDLLWYLRRGVQFQFGIAVAEPLFNEGIRDGFVRGLEFSS